MADYSDNSSIATFRKSTLGLSEISISPLITASASLITFGGAKNLHSVEKSDEVLFVARLL